MCKFRANDCNYIPIVSSSSRCVSVSKCTHNALVKVRSRRNPSLLFFFFFLLLLLLRLLLSPFLFLYTPTAFFFFSSDASQNIDNVLFLLLRLTRDIEDELNKFEKKNTQQWPRCMIFCIFLLTTNHSELDVNDRFDRERFQARKKNYFLQSAYAQAFDVISFKDDCSQNISDEGKKHTYEPSRNRWEEYSNRRQYLTNRERVN